MGKKMHLLRIFPREAFPHVQLKPRRSKHGGRHVLQVECKVAGAVLVQSELRDTRLLVGGTYRTLTMACMASNFTNRLMREVRKEVKYRLREEPDKLQHLRDVKDHEYIRVPHINNSAMDPFDWCKVRFYSKNPNNFDYWVKDVVGKLLNNKRTHREANAKISEQANKYAEQIIILTSGKRERDPEKPENEYQDPDHWRNKINDYLASAQFNVHDPMGKPQAKNLKNVQINYLYAPRITAVGGGPNMMPLVYHLHIDGPALGSPCFFNKNFTVCSKRVKSLDRSKAQGHFSKLEKNFFLGNDILTLPRIHISTYKDHNYFGGTFLEDYVKDVGLKVLPWSNHQHKEHTFPQDPLSEDAIKKLDFNQGTTPDPLQPKQSSNENDRMGRGGIDNVEQGDTQEDVEMNDNDAHAEDEKGYGSDSGSSGSDSDSESDGDNSTDNEVMPNI
ncbi:hypothetical protein GOP47_0016688 [Adiantum capillus-veneris]|uniref:Uncharacterized protein n=1 Tax=Adiantum capillus-veneris TaxID=13818 RepID=A0A9D4UJ20_ADICA|nr:hypothetical protein GOP47_0016688 [Adiantum capillus-veneris]